MADRTLIIAEAGVNHNGSRDMALALVDAAADAGADIVKFQTFKASKLATSAAAKAAYQEANTGQAGSQVDMLRALELSPEDHHALLARCEARGIAFMSTGFDPESLAFLGSLKMPAVKIPSGDITCAPLLMQAARMGRPLLVSTGMASLAEIEEALGVIAFALVASGEPSGKESFEAAYHSPAGQRALVEQVTLLHCVTQYPTPIDAVNLRCMATMAAAFGLRVGYSDHTLGSEIPIAAVALGATVIEKHFTLDRTLPGPDHAASLNPADLSAMVAAIRSVERGLGHALKGPTPEELPNRAVARRSLVAARAISRGEQLTADMIEAKRPGTGISPMELWTMLGTLASRDFLPDELLER